jgi:hypothetical protein
MTCTAPVCCFLLTRVQQPIQAGYLVAGAIVGPGGLGLIKVWACHDLSCASQTSLADSAKPMLFRLCQQASLRLLKVVAGKVALGIHQYLTMHTSHIHNRDAAPTLPACVAVLCTNLRSWSRSRPWHSWACTASSSSSALSLGTPLTWLTTCTLT